MNRVRLRIERGGFGVQSGRGKRQGACHHGDQGEGMNPGAKDVGDQDSAERAFLFHRIQWF